MGDLLLTWDDTLWFLNPVTWFDYAWDYAIQYIWKWVGDLLGGIDLSKLEDLKN